MGGAAYLRHLALHLLAVLVVDVGDDPSDGGPHFLDGAHVSAVGGASRPLGGRGLSLTLGGKNNSGESGRRRMLGSPGEPGGPRIRRSVPERPGSEAAPAQNQSAERRSAAGAEAQRHGREGGEHRQTPPHNPKEMGLEQKVLQ